jgi:hypothetical protein
VADGRGRHGHEPRQRADFFAKLVRLETDGLPAYEQRFFELLQNQSHQNLAALSTYLNDARKAILERMDLVNDSLGQVPTEQADLRQVDGVRAWVSAWQGWQGGGTLSWCDRRWKALGVQRLPEKLALRGPEDVAMWIGESARWERAQSRYQALIARWPVLAQQLSRYFDVLADYSDADYQRLAEMLDWIASHPNSNL